MSPDFLDKFLLIALGVLGATVGSFLNVVIHRLPRGLSVNEPRRSFCPTCGQQLSILQNLPLLSWLFLRGKCATCGGRISPRYFWVELLTALTFVGVGMHFGPVIDLPVLVVGLCVWLSLLIAIVFIDLEHMVIPLSLSISGILVGLLLGLWQPSFIGAEDWVHGLSHSGMGAAVGFLGIWMVVELGKRVFGRKTIKCPEGGGDWHLSEPESDDEDLQFVVAGQRLNWSEIFSRKSDRLILKGASLVVDGKSRGEQEEVVLHWDRVQYGRREERIEALKSLSGTATELVIPREAMGMGDAHLMAMIGALLGWEAVLFTVFAGSLCGIGVALIGRLGFGSQIPFGPCLAMGAVAWMWGGQRLWEWYLSLPAEWSSNLGQLFAL